MAYFEPELAHFEPELAYWLCRRLVFSLFQENLYALTMYRALLISELAEHSSENNNGVSSIVSPVYAIKWGYAMAGIEACRVLHPSE